MMLFYAKMKIFLFIALVLASASLALAVPHLVFTDDEHFAFMANDGLGNLEKTFFKTTEIREPHNVNAADFDQDGAWDAVVTYWHDARFTLYWGIRGDLEHFEQQDYQILPGGAHEPHASGIGDFNEDGLVDLAIVDNGGDSDHGVYIVLNQGKREFAFHKHFPLPQSNIRYISVGHFNNDQHWDLIVSDVNSNSFFLFLGDGQGNFEWKRVEVPTVVGFNVISWGDVDNDGDQEIVIANANYITILRNDGKAEFSDFLNIGSQGGWQAAQLADVDNDLILDLVAIKINSFNIYKGYGKEVECPRREGVPPSFGWFCPYYRKQWSAEKVLEIKVADFDEDGFVDMAFGDHRKNGLNRVSLYMNSIDHIPDLGSNCLAPPGGVSPECFISLDFDVARGAEGDSWQAMLAIYEGEARKMKFLRGDSNEDGAVNLADAVHVLNWLFQGGKAPLCEDRGDANDDGTVNIADAISILNHLFLGGPALPEPFPESGIDLTADELECKA